MQKNMSNMKKALQIAEQEIKKAKAKCLMITVTTQIKKFQTTFRSKTSSRTKLGKQKATLPAKKNCFNNWNQNWQSIQDTDSSLIGEQQT